jgi:hypothetical protein
MTAPSVHSPLVIGLCVQCGTKPRYEKPKGGLSHWCKSCFSANRRTRQEPLRQAETARDHLTGAAAITAKEAT